MGYFDYLQHGKKMFLKRGQLPVYLVYFITDACNAKCKHCLLADGAEVLAGYGRQRTFTTVRPGVKVAKWLFCAPA